MARFKFNFAGTRDEAIEQVRASYLEGKYNLDITIKSRFNGVKIVLNGSGTEIARFLNTELTWKAI